MPLTAHDITGLRDPYLGKLLDTYQGSFPLSEQMPLSWWVKTIIALEEKTLSGARIQAFLDGEAFVGWAMYEWTDGLPSIGYLWYIAVDPGLRGRGHGSAIVAQVFNALYARGCQVVVLECELPEVEAALSHEAHQVASRRLEWYRRMGARRLTGIQYMQDVGWWPKKAMAVMVHARDCISPEQAFSAAKQVLARDSSGNLSQIGALDLE